MPSENFGRSSSKKSRWIFTSVAMVIVAFVITPCGALTLPSFGDLQQAFVNIHHQIKKHMLLLNNKYYDVEVDDHNHWITLNPKGGKKHTSTIIFMHGWSMEAKDFLEGNTA